MINLYKELREISLFKFNDDTRDTAIKHLMNCQNQFPTYDQKGQEIIEL